MAVNEAEYRNKKILITGGLGFLGSTLAHRLVEMNARVTIIDSLIPDFGGNPFNVDKIKKDVDIHISDVRDRDSMNYHIKNKDMVFNLAGTLSHIDSMKNPFVDLEINCVSQLAILEACRNFNPELKILFAGTRGQYGKADYLPVDEKHPMHPTDVNGINNIAGEWYHILYNNVYGIRATSLRLTNTYGPRHQMRHARQGVLNWFIRQIIDDEPVELYGDGLQKRDINYVDDVVNAFLLAMQNEKTNGQVYNLGGEALGLKEFIETVITVTGKGRYRMVAFQESHKAIEIGDYIADYTKFKQATGWEPQVTLSQGIASTVAYYTKNKKQYW